MRPSGGWDEADTVTSFDEPIMSSKPPVAVNEVRSEMRDLGGASRARPPVPSSREEIWTIVRAAVEEAVIPLVQRMRDLELRLERAEQAARDAHGDAHGDAVSTLKTAGAQRPAPPKNVPHVSDPPKVDLAAIARTDVGGIEGYDGGKRKKMLGKVIVGVLLVGVLVIIISSLASQS